MSLVFNGNSTIDNIVFNGQDVEHLVYNGVEVWSKSKDYSQEYFTAEILSSGSIVIQCAYRGTARRNTFYYSKNGGEWTEFTWSSGGSYIWAASLTSLVAGDKVRIKCNPTTNFYYWSSSSAYSITNITFTSDVDLSGNIMSLQGGDNFKTLTSVTYLMSALFSKISAATASGPTYVTDTHIKSCDNLIFPDITLPTNSGSTNGGFFYRTFRNCTGLTSTPQLLINNLNYGCYSNMFENCTSLTKINEITATGLNNYCFYYMFSGCTGLTTLPVNLIQATTLASYCCSYMFNNCTGLIEANTNLPSTTATYCYQYMFSGCNNLITAPNLPSTTVTNYCYFYMFYNCSKLINVPTILPATTLANSCYQSMFTGCTSLTTAPILPATTLVQYCYQSMFQYCTSLNYIKALFKTTPGTGYTSSWVKDVASSGTFVKHTSATWNVSGNNGIPSGWTVQKASS